MYSTIHSKFKDDLTRRRHTKARRHAGGATGTREGHGLSSHHGRWYAGCKAHSEYVRGKRLKYSALTWRSQTNTPASRNTGASAWSKLPRQIDHSSGIRKYELDT